MSYNTVHHHDEAEVADTHDDHDEKNSQVANGSQVRHHEHKDDDTKSTNKNDDNCCNHKVVDIAQLDKAIPQSVQLNHVFFADFIPVFYNSPTSYSSGFIKSNKYFVRSHHPPIPDIRIAIQSFQI